MGQDLNNIKFPLMFYSCYMTWTHWYAVNAINHYKNQNSIAFFKNFICICWSGSGPAPQEARAREREENRRKLEQQKKKKQLWKENDSWGHDKFNECDQQPKSHAEIVAVYGYDIRNEDNAPRARRRRRYG